MNEPMKISVERKQDSGQTDLTLIVSGVVWEEETMRFSMIFPNYTPKDTIDYFEQMLKRFDVFFCKHPVVASYFLCGSPNISVSCHCGFTSSRQSCGVLLSSVDIMPGDQPMLEKIARIDCIHAQGDNQDEVKENMDSNLYRLLTTAWFYRLKCNYKLQSLYEQLKNDIDTI